MGRVKPSRVKRMPVVVEPAPSAHRGLSIAALLVFFPLGLVAFWSSFRCAKALDGDDMESARRFSRDALAWSKVALVAGVVVWVAAVIASPFVARAFSEPPITYPIAPVDSPASPTPTPSGSPVAVTPGEPVAVTPGEPVATP